MRISVWLLLAAMATVLPAAAQQVVEYSADTLEKDSRQGERKGRIYVGNNRVRTEMSANGKTLVQVVDMQRQLMMMINPNDRTYMVRQAREGAYPAGKSGDSSKADPCAGMPNVSCKKAGVETINGNPAMKWEITGQSGQSPGTMIFWIDEKRQFPVRQKMPDGSVMEMKSVGDEQVSGRHTEKWSRTVTGPDGKSLISFHWYDPELKSNIKEHQPGGYSRVLTNIKVGPQADELFKAPDGYRKIEPGQ